MRTTLARRSTHGFTIVELLITTVILVIVGLATGAVMVDAQSSWNVMYGRINSDVIADGYAAKAKFDSVMRRASRENIFLGDSGSWIEACSYADDASTVVDRYWRFYASGGDLIAEYGQLKPRETLNVQTVCRNVSALTFRQFGYAIQMTLVLDNGERTNTVVSSAVAHNQ
jgi:prepilin-type N-terminal cleavage/methylation domain-containing protein